MRRRRVAEAAASRTRYISDVAIDDHDDISTLWDEAPGELENLLSELEDLDALAARRARFLLSPDAATVVPIFTRLWAVAAMRKVRRVGFGKLSDPGVNKGVRKPVREAYEQAVGFSEILRQVDPSWTTLSRVRDVLKALQLSLDSADALGALHDAAMGVLEEHAERPASSQREFLEEVLNQVLPLPRDQDEVMRKALRMLTAIFDDGPRFGIAVGRPVTLPDAIACLGRMMESRFSKTRGWDNLTGELKAKPVLRDVLVSVGMTPAEAEAAVKRIAVRWAGPRSTND